MELRFTHTESTFSYFAATRTYLERHGKPVAFYGDKVSVFRVNHPHATGGDGHTQFAIPGKGDLSIHIDDALVQRRTHAHEFAFVLEQRPAIATQQQSHAGGPRIRSPRPDSGTLQRLWPNAAARSCASAMD